jgi:hypothetical protein
MNAREVRDEIIACMLETQQETIMRMMGPGKSDQEHRAFVTAFLTRAFQETRGDYDHPNRAQLEAAIRWLIDTLPAPKHQDAVRHRERIHSLIATLDSDEPR